MIDIFKNNNKIQMLALDHRGSFVKMLSSICDDDKPEDLAVEIKLEIINALFELFSATLIDTNFGLPAYYSATSIPKPFLLPLEKSGYEDTNKGRLTNLMYSAAQLKELGAAGVKLLVYLNPDEEIFSDQLKLINNSISDAHRKNLPIFLEIVTYGETTVYDTLEAIVNQDVAPDVFKLEYPGSTEDCEKITMLLSGIPWILLTRGVEYEEFLNKLQIATKAGCSGFLAGRSIWQEGLQIKDKYERITFFETVSKKRFKQIIDVTLNSS